MKTNNDGFSEGPLKVKLYPSINGGILHIRYYEKIDLKAEKIYNAIITTKEKIFQFTFKKEDITQSYNNYYEIMKKDETSNEIFEANSKIKFGQGGTMIVNEII